MEDSVSVIKVSPAPPKTAAKPYIIEFIKLPTIFPKSKSGNPPTNAPAENHKAPLQVSKNINQNPCRNKNYEPVPAPAVALAVRNMAKTKAGKNDKTPLVSESGAKTKTKRTEIEKRSAFVGQENIDSPIASSFPSRASPILWSQITRQTKMADTEPSRKKQRFEKIPTPEGNNVSNVNLTTNNEPFTNNMINNEAFINNLNMMSNDPFVNDVNMMSNNEPFISDVNMINNESFVNIVNMISNETFDNIVNMISNETFANNLNLMTNEPFVNNVDMMSNEPFVNNVDMISNEPFVNNNVNMMSNEPFVNNNVNMMSNEPFTNNEPCIDNVNLMRNEPYIDNRLFVENKELVGHITLVENGQVMGNRAFTGSGQLMGNRPLLVKINGYFVQDRNNRMMGENKSACPGRFIGPLVNEPQKKITFARQGNIPSGSSSPLPASSIHSSQITRQATMTEHISPNKQRCGIIPAPEGNRTFVGNGLIKEKARSDANGKFKRKVPLIEDDSKEDQSLMVEKKLSGVKGPFFDKQPLMGPSVTEVEAEIVAFEQQKSTSPRTNPIPARSPSPVLWSQITRSTKLADDWLDNIKIPSAPQGQSTFSTTKNGPAMEDAVQTRNNRKPDNKVDLPMEVPPPICFTRGKHRSCGHFVEFLVNYKGTLEDLKCIAFNSVWKEGIHAYKRLKCDSIVNKVKVLGQFITALGSGEFSDVYQYCLKRLKQSEFKNWKNKSFAEFVAFCQEFKQKQAVNGTIEVTKKSAGKSTKNRRIRDARFAIQGSGAS